MDWEPSRNDPSMDDIFDRFSESINRFGQSNNRRPTGGRRPHGSRRSGFRREDMMRRDFLRLESLRMRLRGNN